MVNLGRIVVKHHISCLYWHHSLWSNVWPETPYPNSIP